MHRLTALFLCISLTLLESVGYAQPQTMDPASPAGGYRPWTIDQTKISVPSELGKIEEVYLAPRSTQYAVPKTIVYIQDAHDSLEAQENIAKILTYLTAEHGLKTVYEEGYEGKVPTDRYFDFIQDSKVREKVSYYLLDQLLIGGAEYAHINRPLFQEESSLPTGQAGVRGDFELIGADSIKMHLQNIEWYRQLAQNREAILRDLEEIHSEIQRLADTAYPKIIKEWIKLKDRYDTNQLNLLDYLKRTLNLSQIAESNAYPVLHLLISAENTKDVAVQQKAASLDAKALFLEIENLENEIISRELKTRDARILYQYDQGLRLLKRLAKAEVSATEYDASKYGLNKLQTKNLAQFIADRTRKTVVLSRKWENAIQNALQFYEAARAREKSLDLALQENKDELSALVFGGFHKEGIKEILKKKGISYVIVSPTITSFDERHQEYYRKLMSEGMTLGETPAILARAARAVTLFLLNLKPDVRRQNTRMLYLAAAVANQNPELPASLLNLKISKELRDISKPNARFLPPSSAGEEIVQKRSELRSFAEFEDQFYEMLAKRAKELELESFDVLDFNGREIFNFIRTWLRFHRGYGPKVWVAVDDDGTVNGFHLLLRGGGRKDLQVTEPVPAGAYAVSRQVRGQGIASSLVQEGFKYLKARGERYYMAVINRSNEGSFRTLHSAARAVGARVFDATKRDFRATMERTFFVDFMPEKERPSGLQDYLPENVDQAWAELIRKKAVKQSWKSKLAFFNRFSLRQPKKEPFHILTAEQLMEVERQNLNRSEIRNSKMKMVGIIAGLSLASGAAAVPAAILAHRFSLNLSIEGQAIVVSAAVNFFLFIPMQVMDSLSAQPAPAGAEPSKIGTAFNSIVDYFRELYKSGQDDENPYRSPQSISRRSELRSEQDQKQIQEFMDLLREVRSADTEKKLFLLETQLIQHPVTVLVKPPLVWDEKEERLTLRFETGYTLLRTELEGSGENGIKTKIMPSFWKFKGIYKGHVLLETLNNQPDIRNKYSVSQWLTLIDPKAFAEDVQAGNYKHLTYRAPKKEIVQKEAARSEIRAVQNQNFESLIPPDIHEGSSLRSEILKHYSKKLDFSAAETAGIRSRNVLKVQKEHGIDDLVDLIRSLAEKFQASPETPVRILDVGAGIGSFLSDLSDQMATVSVSGNPLSEIVELHGLDPIPLTEEQRQALRPGIRFHEGLGEFMYIPAAQTFLPDDHFHLILATQVMQYSFDPYAFIERIYAKLIPGGTAYISTFTLGDFSFEGSRNKRFDDYLPELSQMKLDFRNNRLQLRKDSEVSRLAMPFQVYRKEDSRSVKIRYLRQKDSGYMPHFASRSEVRSNSKNLKEVLAQYTGEDKPAVKEIAFEAGGHAFTTYPDFMRDVLDVLEAQPIQRPEGLPVRRKIPAEQILEINLNELPLQESDLKNPTHIFGRTLEYRKDGKAFHLKFLKKGEDPALLAYEYEMMNFLENRKEQWGLHGNYPKGLVRIARVPARIFSKIFEGAFQRNEIETPLEDTNGYFTFMAYETDLIRGENPYFTYLNDPDLEHEKFFKAFFVNIHDRFTLAKHGLFDPGIIELFHTRNAAPYDWMFDLYRREGSGMMTNITQATLYPNMRLSGPADFAELGYIDDIFNEWQKNYRTYQLTAWLGEEQIKEMGSLRDYFTARLLGDTLLAFALMPPTYLERRGELSYKDENLLQNTFLQKALKVLFVYSYHVYAEGNQGYHKFDLDFSLMARQMAYFLTNQYVQDYQNGKNIPAVLFPGALITQIVPDPQNWNSSRGWDSQKEEYRIYPWRQENRVTRFSRDSGPLGGANSLQALVGSLYMATSLMIAGTENFRSEIRSEGAVNRTSLSSAEQFLVKWIIRDFSVNHQQYTKNELYLSVHYEPAAADSGNNAGKLIITTGDNGNGFRIQDRTNPDTGVVEPGLRSVARTLLEMQNEGDMVFSVADQSQDEIREILTQMAEPENPTLENLNRFLIDLDGAIPRTTRDNIRNGLTTLAGRGFAVAAAHLRKIGGDLRIISNQPGNVRIRFEVPITKKETGAEELIPLSDFIQSELDTYSQKAQKWGLELKTEIPFLSRSEARKDPSTDQGPQSIEQKEKKSLVSSLRSSVSIRRSGRNLNDFGTPLRTGRSELRKSINRRDFLRAALVMAGLVGSSAALSVPIPEEFRSKKQERDELEKEAPELIKNLANPDVDLIERKGIWKRLENVRKNEIPVLREDAKKWKDKESLENLDSIQRRIGEVFESALKAVGRNIERAELVIQNSGKDPKKTDKAQKDQAAEMEFGFFLIEDFISRDGWRKFEGWSDDVKKNRAVLIKDSPAYVAYFDISRRYFFNNPEDKEKNPEVYSRALENLKAIDAGQALPNRDQFIKDFTREVTEKFKENLKTSNRSEMRHASGQEPDENKKDVLFAGAIQKLNPHERESYRILYAVQSVFRNLADTISGAMQGAEIRVDSAVLKQEVLEFVDNMIAMEDEEDEQHRDSYSELFNLGAVEIIAREVNDKRLAEFLNDFAGKDASGELKNPAWVQKIRRLTESLLVLNPEQEKLILSADYTAQIERKLKEARQLLQARDSAAREESYQRGAVILKDLAQRGYSQEVMRQLQELKKKLGKLYTEIEEFIMSEDILDIERAAGRRSEMRTLSPEEIERADRRIYEIQQELRRLVGIWVLDGRVQGGAEAIEDMIPYFDEEFSERVITELRGGEKDAPWELVTGTAQMLRQIELSGEFPFIHQPAIYADGLETTQGGFGDLSTNTPGSFPLSTAQDYVNLASTYYLLADERVAEADRRAARLVREYIEKMFEGREWIGIPEGDKDIIYKLASRIQGQNREAGVLGQVWNGDARRGHVHDILAVSVLPNGQIVTASRDHTARIWDVSDPENPETVSFLGRVGNENSAHGHVAAILAVSVLPNGQIVTAGDDRTARIWDVSDLANPRMMSVLGRVNNEDSAYGHVKPIIAVSVLPNARLPARQGQIVTASSDHTVRIWDVSDLANPRMIGVLGRARNNNSAYGHVDAIWGVSVLPNGQIVTAGWDHTARIWDVSDPVNPKMVSVLGRARSEDSRRGHVAAILAVSVLPNRQIVTAGDDRTARIWDVSDPVNPRVVSVLGRVNNEESAYGHVHMIWGVSVLPNGQIVTVSRDRTARIWNLLPPVSATPRSESRASDEDKLKALEVWAKEHKGQKISRTQQEIADEFGILKWIVIAMLKKYGITTRGAGKEITKPGQDLRDWAEAHKGQSIPETQQEIADRFGVSVVTVHKVFQKNDITRAKAKNLDLLAVRSGRDPNDHGTSPGFSPPSERVGRDVLRSEVRSPETAELIAKLLNAQASNHRLKAAEHLRHFAFAQAAGAAHAQEVIPALIEAFHQTYNRPNDWQVRVEILTALVPWVNRFENEVLEKIPEVMKTLTAALNNEDDRVQKAALWAIGEMAQHVGTAIPELTGVIAQDSNSANVKKAAVAALEKIGRSEAKIIVDRPVLSDKTADIQMTAQKPREELILPAGRLEQLLDIQRKKRNEWIELLKLLADRIPQEKEATIANAAAVSEGKLSAQVIRNAVSLHQIPYHEVGLVKETDAARAREKWVKELKRLAGKVPEGQEATVANAAAASEGKFSAQAIRNVFYRYQISYDEVGMVREVEEPRSREEWILELKVLSGKVPEGQGATIANVADASNGRLSAADIRIAFKNHQITYEEVGLARERAKYKDREEWVMELKELAAKIPQDQEATAVNIAKVSGGKFQAQDIRIALNNHQITYEEVGMAKGKRGGGPASLRSEVRIDDAQAQRNIQDTLKQIDLKLRKLSQEEKDWLRRYLLGESDLLETADQIVKISAGHWQQAAVEILVALRATVGYRLDKKALKTITDYLKEQKSIAEASQELQTFQFSDEDALNVLHLADAVYIEQYLFPQRKNLGASEKLEARMKNLTSRQRKTLLKNSDILLWWYKTLLDDPSVQVGDFDRLSRDLLEEIEKEQFVLHIYSNPEIPVITEKALLTKGETEKQAEIIRLAQEALGKIPDILFQTWLQIYQDVLKTSSEKPGFEPASFPSVQEVFRAVMEKEELGALRAVQPEYIQNFLAYHAKKSRFDLTELINVREKLQLGNPSNFEAQLEAHQDIIRRALRLGFDFALEVPPALSFNLDIQKASEKVNHPGALNLDKHAFKEIVGFVRESRKNISALIKKAVQTPSPENDKNIEMELARQLKRTNVRYITDSAKARIQAYISNLPANLAGNSEKLNNLRSELRVSKSGTEVLLKILEPMKKYGLKASLLYPQSWPDSESVKIEVIPQSAEHENLAMHALAKLVQGHRLEDVDKDEHRWAVIRQQELASFLHELPEYKFTPVLTHRSELRTAYGVQQKTESNDIVRKTIEDSKEKMTIFVDMEDAANLTESQWAEDYEKIAIRNKNISFIFYNDRFNLTAESRARIEGLQHQLGYQRIVTTSAANASVFRKYGGHGKAIHISKRKTAENLDQIQQQVPRKEDFTFFRYQGDEIGVVPVALIYALGEGIARKNAVMDLSMVSEKIAAQVQQYLASLVIARAA